MTEWRASYTERLQAEAYRPPELPLITDQKGWHFIRPIRGIKLKMSLDVKKLAHPVWTEKLT